MSDHTTYHVSIKLIPGDVAPRYGDAEGLRLEDVVITEQGTRAGLPIVDLVCKDGRGNPFVISTTGRVINGLAAAIRGVNLKNHGLEEP